MKYRLSTAVLGTSALLIAACGGGGSGGSPEGTIGDSGSNMDIFQASNGYGLLLPHQVMIADSNGFPTINPIAITSIATMVANVTPNNRILSTPSWPSTAILPNGRDGNHFLYTRFTQPIEVDSVLDKAPGSQVNSGLIGSISVISVNPITGESKLLKGRGFIDGKTYSGIPQGSPSELPLQQWVTLSNGLPVAMDVDGEMPGLGFPGTEDTLGFAGIQDLVSPNTFIFIPDEDGDLSTHETFPSNLQVQMVMNTSVVSTSGQVLLRRGVASSMVGGDLLAPEVAQAPPPAGTPSIIPGNGETNVDPLTDIILEFSEPIQPLTVGPLPTGDPPTVGSSVLIQFGPSASTVTVPFTVEPVSVYDLTRLCLTPSYNFPGTGPVVASCGIFNEVSITVNTQQFQDLSGNRNLLGPATKFTTGEGPGLINSVVAPDAIYIGRKGAGSNISVIDLNGYGQGTGNPTYDPSEYVKGNTNFPNNPNAAFQPTALIPPLQLGSCTIDGGSAGVFTLQLDSSLNSALATSPLIESVSDMALGHALDSIFNNGPPPFGCQAGGGNNCAQTGLKQVSPTPTGQSTLGPVQAGQFAAAYTGAENQISWAPHPNPPTLTFPPLCISPYIGGQEPTSIDTLATNLLVPGPFPLGFPPAPPLGLLTQEQNAYFLGPSTPQPTFTNCTPYGIRQQVGHFLYVADRVRNEVVVLNSNRFTLIDRIPVSDPTSFAVGPNLDFLAVTNHSAGTVSFIDINPTSSTFHTIKKKVAVGKGPTGLAWQSGNEDILVCNELDNSVTVISAWSLEVRKTLKNQLSAPFDIATTPRQMVHGFRRQVYFAYILNRNGAISLFESGPSGTNGWGFDDIIGQPAYKFNNPKAIQTDIRDLNSGIWIAHEDQLDVNGLLTGVDGGAMSKMGIWVAFVGPVPLTLQSFQNPNLRDIDFAIPVSIGSDQLSGIPTDMAFDNMMNRGALPNYSVPPWSAPSPAPFNGKSLVKPVPNGVVITSTPRYIFVAIPNSTQGGGVVDVISLESGYQRFDTDPFQSGIQSIPAPGVTTLMDYFRQ